MYITKESDFAYPVTPDSKRDLTTITLKALRGPLPDAESRGAVLIQAMIRVADFASA